MSVTKAVFLAAGEGTRMRPLTYTRPKVMLPLANKPILEHLLLEMKDVGIDSFLFIVGYHDEQIRSYFENGSRWGLNIQYCIQRQQSEPPTRSGCVKDLSTKILLANGGSSGRGHLSID
jgi:bifunctional UDP-N-acetylglucosamine pyrophosphorylase/glucosamine-1-phosphate N-acetyltransferase